MTAVLVAIGALTLAAFALIPQYNRRRVRTHTVRHVRGALTWLEPAGSAAVPDRPAAPAPPTRGSGGFSTNGAQHRSGSVAVQTLLAPRHRRAS